MKVLCQLERMSKKQIKHLIERLLPEVGLIDTALKGVGDRAHALHTCRL